MSTHRVPCRRSALAVILTLALVRAASAADFTDPVTGAQWAQAALPQDLQSQGYRLATVTDVQQLLQSTGYRDQSSGSSFDWYAQQPYGATGASANLLATELKTQHCEVMGSSPNVCFRSSVIASDATASGLQVFQIRSSVFGASSGAPPDTTLVANLSSSVPTYAGNFRVVMRPDAYWFESSGLYQTGFDPVKQQGIYTEGYLFDRPVPYLMVRDVPEPGTWVLMGLGLVGMAGALGRQRRAQAA